MELKPDYSLAAVRAEIPLLRTSIAMNACSQGPQTRAARDAALRFMDSWDRDGMDWERWLTEVEAARAGFARLIGADEDEISVATSVSQAVSSLASAIDLTGGRSRVVLTEAEFPTVAQVWAAQRGRGAVLEWLPVREGELDGDALRSAIDEKTAVVSITHGDFRTGTLNDLEVPLRRARAAGAISVVDAYQTLGTRRIDVRHLGVDVLVGGSLKYLMGTAGIAFMYVRRELADRLQPTTTGWFGRRDPLAFDARTLDWADAARRFDTGTPPLLAAYIARAGLDTLHDLGMGAVERWNRVLSHRLVYGGITRGFRLEGPRSSDRRTPVAAFHVPDAARVERELRRLGVLASARGDVVRLAPHYYSTLNDVDDSLGALTEVVAHDR